MIDQKARKQLAEDVGRTFYEKSDSADENRMPMLSSLTDPALPIEAGHYEYKSYSLGFMLPSNVTREEAEKALRSVVLLPLSDE